MLNPASSDSGAASGATATLPDRVRSPINLWLVDDNHRMRDTLMELFGRCEGINCTAAFASPNEVLSTLASKVGPDVILLDVHMGDLNGLDAIRPIKSLSRSTQVLMLTTFFDSESQTRALSDGASGFLLKSFPIEIILNSIREAWRKPAPHAKRKPAQNLVSAPTLNSDLRSAAPELISTGCDRTNGASDSSRKRSLWVKHCLDMIRNIRN
jgi:DNA-binding NarL/FixJ family response regulator